MTKHARSSSFLLLTGNEAPQDALLSTESIEVRPLVPKGILSVRQTGSCRLACKDKIPIFKAIHYLYIPNFSVSFYSLFLLLTSQNKDHLFPLHNHKYLHNTPYQKIIYKYNNS